MAVVKPPNPLPPDENINPTLIGVSGTLIAFVIITSCLRLWVRLARHSLGWDDYTMAMVTVLATARFGVQVAQGTFGNGRHRWYLEKHDYQTSNMLGWFAQILLFASICLLKCSIMLLLLRIKNTKSLKITLYSVMAGLVVTNFGCIIILLAECDPVSAYWTGVGTCWEPKIRIYSIYLTISYSVLTDLLCSLLPLVVVWKVQIPFKTKVSVCCLMGLGLIATGFGIVRASSLGLVTSDLSWVYARTAIYSNAELYLGIIAANTALSRQVYVHVFGEKETSSNPSYTPNSHSRTGYLASKLRGDNVGRPETYVQAGRRGSNAKSDHSDIPLEPGIQKRTEVWISEEDLDSDGPADGKNKQQTRWTG
ncbi:hypothetical protein HYQ45_008521 [Verticillium longisporum]|uniref:Rhodopsin domain-containing protein n=3 Tax=Verticillium TaxID=1036719 RepID=A0A2J8F4G0_VERDA|nr:(S)-2-haloacid dehalogenase 4A [Verticillium dahliae VDG2]KAF3356730.1 hypothetical protein VdG1_03667 [Verticillium dahliae VDG1]KAG7133242.1 hypothetical protein HYQ45_008521 [Verticillium longisporum]KAH6687061.1 hypothetical protein EV126DRAFT_433239 [Verticillium dahliae]PNH30119.1 hypothetical protein BJF96_g6544 [Verticillium dahliae]